MDPPSEDFSERLVPCLVSAPASFQHPSAASRSFSHLQFFPSAKQRDGTQEDEKDPGPFLPAFSLLHGKKRKKLISDIVYQEKNFSLPPGKKLFLFFIFFYYSVISVDVFLPPGFRRHTDFTSPTFMFDCALFPSFRGGNRLPQDPFFGKSQKKEGRGGRECVFILFRLNSSGLPDIIIKHPVFKKHPDRHMKGGREGRKNY